MTSPASSVRALLVYALVVPMALIMGYLLASPSDLGTWAMVVVILLVLSTPLILARHHEALFLTWNMTAIAFFLPGRVPFWLVLAGFSLFISLFQRALSKEKRFLSAYPVILPLLYLAAVIYITAELNGGFGLRVFGSENVGGKRYVMLFAAIAGFLAMIACPIPREKAGQYVGCFFLGALSCAFGTLAPFLGPQFYVLFLLFPVDWVGVREVGFNADIFRFWGTSLAATGAFSYLLARYGIRHVVSFKHPFRCLLLVLVLAVGCAGGFRSFFILMALTFGCVFYFEGLLRSRYAWGFGAGALLFFALLVPAAPHLPLSLQRTLSFLPLNISPVAEYDAEGSSEWRFEMWRTLLPEVPRHLWLGKGLGISLGELELVGELSRRGQVSSQELAMLAGDYHSGPLSVIIPFGIWGAIGFVWFAAASLRALYLNYRYGDEDLRRINTFLLAYFLARLIFYLVIFGGFYGDLAVFAGIVGLSISLNHGIRRASAPVPAEVGQKAPELEFSRAPVPVLPH